MPEQDNDVLVATTKPELNNEETQNISIVNEPPTVIEQKSDVIVTDTDPKINKKEKYILEVDNDIQNSKYKPIPHINDYSVYCRKDLVPVVDTALDYTRDKIEKHIKSLNLQDDEAFNLDTDKLKKSAKGKGDKLEIEFILKRADNETINKIIITPKGEVVFE